MSLKKQSRFASPQLRNFIQDIAGKEGMKIVECIGEGATDETIEKSTALKIAEIRSILNHLHSYGVVEYVREKNMTSGWFTYTWKLSVDRAMQNFLLMKKKELEGHKQKMSSTDGSTIYVCKKNCGKHEFDRAMDLQFKCPGCKGLMNVLDNDIELRKIEEKISAIETIINNRTS